MCNGPDELGETTARSAKRGRHHNVPPTAGTPNSSTRGKFARRRSSSPSASRHRDAQDPARGLQQSQPAGDGSEGSAKRRLLPSIPETLLQAPDSRRLQVLPVVLPKPHDPCIPSLPRLRSYRAGSRVWPHGENPAERETGRISLCEHPRQEAQQKPIILLSLPEPLTGKNPGNAAGCSKSDTHPVKPGGDRNPGHGRAEWVVGRRSSLGMNARECRWPQASHFCPHPAFPAYKKASEKKACQISRQVLRKGCSKNSASAWRPASRTLCSCDQPKGAGLRSRLWQSCDKPGRSREKVRPGLSPQAGLPRGEL